MEGEIGEKHNRIKHSCIICGKLFQKRNALLIHERIHTGEKLYKCETCKKTFTQSSSLAQHKRSHTGEKPYECDICETRFNQRNHLAEHKRIHTGEKPYSCKICEKAFIKKSNLDEHETIHTGEKPYKCDTCEKAFTARSNLARHKRLHKDITAAHSNRKKSLNENNSNKCSEEKEVESIKEEINEEESVNDPLSIHQDNENKEEDIFDYDKIDIEEFKIEPVNDIDKDRSSSRNFVDCGIY